jgi:hypothetical protein
MMEVPVPVTGTGREWRKGKMDRNCASDEKGNKQTHQNKEEGKNIFKKKTSSVTTTTEPLLLLGVENDNESFSPLKVKKKNLVTRSDFLLVPLETWRLEMQTRRPISSSVNIYFLEINLFWKER